VENILKGESPFSAPTPIFRSPRNLNYMASQPATRNWTQPTAVVLTRPGQASSQGGGYSEIDRWLGSYKMVWSVDDLQYYPDPKLPVTFPSVPHSSLDPNAIIIVECDYVFIGGDTPNIVTVEAYVGNNINLDIYVENSAEDQSLTGSTGRLKAYLNRNGTKFPYNQSVFTGAVPPVNPGAFYMTILVDTGVPGGWAGDLTITNLIIRFNQSPP